MSSEGRELIFIAIAMVVLFIFAIGASLLFIRQWRKEKRDKKK